MLDGSRFADCSSGLMGEVYHERYKVRRDALEKKEISPFLSPHKPLIIGSLIAIAIIILVSLIVIIT